MRKNLKVMCILFLGLVAAFGGPSMRADEAGAETTAQTPPLQFPLGGQLLMRALGDSGASLEFRDAARAQLASMSADEVETQLRRTYRRGYRDAEERLAYRLAALEGERAANLFIELCLEQAAYNSDLLEDILAAWAGHNPEKAIAWWEANRERLGRIITTFWANPHELGRHMRQLEHRLFRGFSESRPSEALDYWRAQKHIDSEGIAINGFSYGVNDPAVALAAFEWMVERFGWPNTSHPFTHYHDDPFSGEDPDPEEQFEKKGAPWGSLILFECFCAHDYRAAMKWLDSQEPEVRWDRDLRVKVVLQGFGTAGAAGGQELIDWYFGDGTVTDLHLYDAEIARHWLVHDPKAATDWALANDADQQTLDRLARFWMIRDKARTQAILKRMPKSYLKEQTRKRFDFIVQEGLYRGD